MSEEFKKACEEVGIPATKRQLSKWAMKKGLAYRVKYGQLKNPKKS